jgi:hypothetical protein
MKERKNYKKEVELMPKMFRTDVSHCRGLLPELILAGRCVLKFAQRSPSRIPKLRPLVHNSCWLKIQCISSVIV